MKRLPSFSSASVLAAVATLFTTSCMAPRAITSSGKVTPRGEFRVGGNQAFNIPTETIGKTGAAVKEAASQLSSQDKVQYSELVDKLQVAALAYVIDPVQPAADLYVRYGALPRLDVGYKYAFGSHVFDAMYQFMGTTGTPESPGGAAGSLYGSIGLQFATQRAKLPSIPYLDDIDGLLRFRANRQDVLVPVVFSRSFGQEEEVGAISFGAVYTHTFLRYGFDPRNIYKSGSNTELLPTLPEQKRDFSSYGAFANVKIGYRYAYVIPAFAMYYQNYGTYQLLNNQTAKLKGFTFIPSIGLQFRIPNLKK
ncbi:hypothetical protein SAMN02745146_2277 [Hymenobacter daecheongensis DSM 21074]|uniref:Outer membrane protein beta-barrel domain-containing protein n=1 Tax=Hymenobacter daecheongensis DSM 21074 TaxID=1121955 RepID=A0A1M6GIU9_9BACT|nr:hypothetical protein [Hymenobacter daecheongensis]SHJ09838.1 hypothetical protein SAMN02745146_2277 [Hymenobacter daecheongensis DSM 21074]